MGPRSNAASTRPTKTYPLLTSGDICMSKFLQQFDMAMFGIYKRAKTEANYNATLFIRMLNEQGGLATAKYLINAAKPSDGYTNLFERGRLDLTVEAMVVQTPKWHELFLEEELEAARRRLVAYGYGFDEQAQLLQTP